MKKMILGMMLVLVGQNYAVACECTSDRGMVTQDQKVRLAELLSTPTVTINEKSGHLSALAFADKDTYVSQCGCSKYFYTLADVSYTSEGKSCSAKVKVKNWNEKIIIQDSSCQ